MSHFLHAAFTHFGLQLRDLVVQVLRAQPNMTVYWRPYTPVTDAQVNARIEKANGLMRGLWAGTPVRLLRVYDYAKARLRDYDDNVHHSQLVPVFLRQLLVDVCRVNCSVEGFKGAKPISFHR